MSASLGRRTIHVKRNFEGASTVGSVKSKYPRDSTRDSQSSSEIPDSVQAPLLIVDSFIYTFRRLRAGDARPGSNSAWTHSWFIGN